MGVGRFTSPDKMVSQIKRGVLDIIGGARAGIADPFLPNKIKAGRVDEIRECIGCNICISSWHDGVPVRCTQNATAGEEWRKGWHPEKFSSPGSDDTVLIIGSGPSGMEAGLIAAKRGYEVTIVDKADTLGGRVNFEASLPGLSAWGRIKDYRLYALQQMANVNLYPANELSCDEVMEFGFQRVVIATGAHWTKTLWSSLEIPVGELDKPNVYTPDDIAAGVVPEGPVLVYDFDNYYMGGVIAEHLVNLGCAVSYATSAGHASAWTIMTNEINFIHQRLEEKSIDIFTRTRLVDFINDKAKMKDVFTDKESDIDAKSIVIVGHRSPNDGLYHDLINQGDKLKASGIKSVDRIGDSLAPGALVHAIYSGHEYARDLDKQHVDLYLRDVPITENGPGQVI